MNIEKKLYQWDTEQKLTGCTGLYVDFPIGNEVYRVETADGTCIIPDELLQTSGSHKVYECMTNNTIRSFAFSVTPRPKPPDYVYTPTERLTFEGLVQRVDDAVAEMIRRADSGEFDGYTPVKGTDYFTTAEIQQIQNEVSSGAIGDFKQTVDSETASFNTNAQEKLATYNQNDSEKTEAYNSNAQTKLADYNANADNRVAEFDARTEQIQTDISNLKITKANKTDLDKTNLYLDALFKLNKGQTWDTIESENESYSVDVPSGSRYVGVDKVGGKSIAWNQLVNGDGHNQNITFLDGKFTYSDFARGVWSLNTNLTLISGHKYYAKASKPFNNVYVMCYTNDAVHRLFQVGNVDIDEIVLDTIATCNYTASEYMLYVNRYGATSDTPISNYEGYVMLFDLTQMFGAGNEPSTVEEFEAMFPNDYYEYCEPTIISSQNDRVDVARADSSITQQITTGFPVLNSAGSVYDYIDIDNGKLHRRVGVVDLGTLNWEYAGVASATCYSTGARWFLRQKMLCVLYTNEMQVEKGIYAVDRVLRVIDSSYTDATTFKAAMSGVMLYYELAEEIITDIEIPTELTDWLTVEAGGSVTFHNADEGKRLLVPNKLSFVRKLDEVSV